MPKTQTFTRSEASKLAENNIIKMAGAIRNLINEGASDYNEIISDPRVWCWLNSARHIIERIETNNN